MAEKATNFNVAITVDDGMRRVPINNSDGEEIGVFRFRPTDIGIIERYNEMVNSFQTVIEPLEALEGDIDGTDNQLNDEDLAALKEAENRLYALVNKMLNSEEAAGACFGKMHPFSPVEGKLYCEVVLQAVGEFISAQFDTETEKMNEKVKKYTARAKKARK